MVFTANVINGRLRIETTDGDDINLTPDFLLGFDGYNRIDLSRVSPDVAINITLNDAVVDASSNNWVTIQTVVGQVVNLDADVSRSNDQQVRFIGGGEVHLADGQFNQLIVGSHGNGSTVYGGTGNEYFRSINGSDTIYAGDGNDVISSFNGGNDYIDGGAGRDIINLASNTFDANDTIIGGNGGGHDDIRIALKADGYHFDTTQLPNLTQIENIYLNGNDNYSVSMKIDNDFVNAAQLDYVIVRFGGRDLTLDASGLQGDNVVRLQGTGEVTLIDGVSHRVAGVNGTDGVEVFGGNLGDYFRSYNDGDTFHGGEGNDAFSDWQHVEGGDYFDGGAGNDTFFTRVDRLTSADTFDGGAGDADRIKYSVFDNTFTLDAADNLRNVTSVEKIQFDSRLSAAQEEASDITVRLTDDFVGSAENNTVSLLAGNLNLHLDNSDLSDDKIVRVFGTGDISVSDDNANTTIIETGQANQGIITYTGDEDNITHTGTEHNDVFYLGEGSSFVQGFGGNDVFHNVGQSEATVHGGAGDDVFFITGNQAAVIGGTGNDIFFAETTNVNFSGITGSEGIDTFQVADGGRLLIGTFSFDVSDIERIIDSGEDNVIDGSSSSVEPVEIHGNAGRDYLIGSSSHDTLYGGMDNDTIIAGAGHDIVNGDIGNDSLVGGTGNDTLNGGLGDDYIAGGAGDDQIYMTLGTDSVEGGAGADQFIFSQTGSRDAEVWDFNINEGDRISIQDQFGNFVDAADITITNDINSVDSSGFVAEHVDGYLTTLYSANTVLGYVYHSFDIDSITDDIFI